MRIRRVLQISTAMGVLSVLAVAGTISTLLVLDARHRTEAQGLDDAIRKVSSMRSLQPDFSYGDNPRATRQWQAVYRQLEPVLANLPAVTGEAELLRDGIIQEHKRIGSLFARLSPGLGQPVPGDMRRMIAGQLGARSAAMVSDVLLIRDLLDRQIGRERMWIIAGVAVSVAVLAGVMLALMRMMYGQIALPIARLETQAATMSAGRLDQPVSVSGTDDVAALADSFDRMRIALRDRLHDLGEIRQRLEEANATLEQRVQERTRQLEEANEAKSRFFANVSHELRTPLALILGPVDEILAETALPTAWRRDLEVVRRNAQTLLATVTDLLDLSRIDAGRSEVARSRIDLVRLAARVVDHFASASAQRGIALRVRGPEVLAADVDADKVGRVLFNLLSNAFKHVPRESGWVEVVLAADGGHAVITVTDNGPGIARGMRDTIFQRYAQGGDRQRRLGTGLGLAIAREFVVLHGGTIQVLDTPGGGACFQVALPREVPGGCVATAVDGMVAAAGGPAGEPVGPDLFGDWGGPAVTAAPETGTADDRPSATALPQVLVVEDNPDLQGFIARTLRSIAQVATADDGVDGLAAIDRLRPDLVLSDIMMPRMTGDEMIAAVRSRPEFADLPMMVLSARADEPLRIRLLRGQVQDYLVKPFAADELRARVANLLQIKRARDLLQAELAGSRNTLEDLAREVAAANRQLRIAADEMRTARDRAEEASRVKTSFLNLVSHELRTPLTQLEIQLALLKRRFRSMINGDQDDGLAVLTAAVRRLSQVVNSVLTYSRIESGPVTVNRTRFDLGALVADACLAVQEDARRHGLGLSCETDAPLPLLVSDPGLVRVMVDNLLDNAIKYTPQGRVVARVSAQDQRLRIEVTDTGIGIGPEVQERVFEPFVHGEEVDHKHTPGVGLGLALVRQIVCALDGRVQLTSTPGEGSTFALILPSLEERKA